MRTFRLASRFILFSFKLSDTYVKRQKTTPLLYWSGTELIWGMHTVIIIAIFYLCLSTIYSLVFLVLHHEANNLRSCN